MTKIESAIPSYLLVIASSCQMYSGTGTAIFDWVRYAKNRFRFHIIMDVENDANFTMVQQFCAEHGVSFTPARGLAIAGCIDSGINEINALLESTEFDFIECVSWANAATNISVLQSQRGNAKLIFVPHSQPQWTLPDPQRYFMVPIAFEQMLRAANYIFVDSPTETKLDAFKMVHQESVHFVPLGVAPEFCHAPTIQVKQTQILCICDCTEQRKRIDLLLDVFARTLVWNPSVRLVLGGKGSNEVIIPENIRFAVTALGYVSRSTLISLYQSSVLFILLSDYEAFGLPIAEALCCGCPVLLNDLDVLRDLFSGMPGVHFIKNSDIEQASRIVHKLLGNRFDRAAIALAATSAFSFDVTYGSKCKIILADRCVQ